MSTKMDKLEAVLDAPPSGGAWDPKLSLKERRRGLSQQGLSSESGVPQSVISDIEAGKLRLTSDVAKRLAPALKSSPEELVHAAYLNELEASALQGKVDPQRLLDQAKRMSEDLPAGEVSEAIIDALVEVIRTALEHYDPTLEEAVPSAALKSAQEPRRDGRGVRQQKPHAPQDGRQEPAQAAMKSEGGPQRDANGYRKGKPNQPRAGR